MGNEGRKQFSCLARGILPAAGGIDWAAARQRAHARPRRNYEGTSSRATLPKSDTAGWTTAPAKLAYLQPALQAVASQRIVGRREAH